jgi:hypothetical protein
MEPLNDEELNRLLSRWEAPQKPASLKRRIFVRRLPLWSRLWTTSLRVPLPVAAAIVLLFVLGFHYLHSSEPAETPGAVPTSLAGFQPVRQLDPILYKGGLK